MKRTKSRFTAKRSDGVYYELTRDTNVKRVVSSIRLENFVFISNEGVWDSRNVSYWINLKEYDHDIRNIDEYCDVYECEAVEVSSKLLILLGLELCYSDIEKKSLTN